MMENDELQAHIKAIRVALSNGEIEMINKKQGDDGFYKADSILLGPAYVAEYRIAPKPLECWALLISDGSGEFQGWTACEEQAEDWKKIERGRTVLMREVTDE